MARTLPEWRGKTDDTKAPPRVRLRCFEAHGGKCHISGIKIGPGDAWELDHIVALVNGGQNIESNLAPALKDKHREKTNEDVAIKARDRRIRRKHLGITTPKPVFPGSKASKYKRTIDGRTVRR